MAKKGAQQSGGTKTSKRGKDQAMAAHLPPSPVTWNRTPHLPPYHANKGVTHQRPGTRRTPHQ